MKILYFASLRENIHTSSERLQLEQSCTVKQLRKKLIRKYGVQHFPDTILCAVNHTLANDATRLNNTDEVAFYPPVTGG